MQNMSAKESLKSLTALAVTLLGISSLKVESIASEPQFDNEIENRPPYTCEALTQASQGSGFQVRRDFDTLSDTEREECKTGATPFDRLIDVLIDERI